VITATTHLYEIRLNLTQRLRATRPMSEVMLLGETVIARKDRSSDPSETTPHSAK
jgi:hypothetical protein